MRLRYYTHHPCTHAHPVVKSEGEQDTTSSEWITLSCLNMRPTRWATVVLPVPGDPVKRKFRLMACGASKSAQGQEDLAT